MSATGPRPGTPVPGTVVVTGAARGLGRAIAHRVARKDRPVAVVDLDLRSYAHFPAEKALMTHESTDAELRAAGFCSRGYEADLTDLDRVRDTIAAIENDLGPITGLVCNAGGGSGGIHDNRAGSLASAALEQALRHNLTTTVNTCVAVVPGMVTRGRGSVVVMSSVNGVDPTEDGAYAHYGVAKAAVTMYARYLARDVGPAGVRVNVIAPGTVPTGRLKDLWAGTPGQDPAARTALRRLPEPSEVADSAHYLLDDHSSYVTGQVLVLDGGRTP
ncbi:SDR family NAD(P)-dependent oxidoreductase [Streptomyces sp. R39]|uniref:SDR family NAD(P)-dependent oxidoreductase n=1 Tax=Streptomyces sp. R39 TaxID=3238631 RepID=A0AB39R1X7_9ACTN